MDIRGMIKFSLIDFPERIAAVLFTGGCNMRCAFCHNPHLVLDPASQPLVREQKILNFLESRIGKLDGVVISGGEPALQKDLKQFTEKLRSMDYAVKIDSNGSKPEILENLHKEGLVQMFGIDYKAPAAKYFEICGLNDANLAEKVKSTIEYAVRNNVPFEVRTTVHRELLSIDDLKQMRKELFDMGVKDWTLQQFNPVEVLKDELKTLATYSDSELVRTAREIGDTKVKGLSGIYLN